MIIQSRNVWLNEQFVPAQIGFENGKITGIYHYDEKTADIDYGNLQILPGLIDIHTHGWNDVNANHPSVEDMERWSKHMPKEGVTSFLAGTYTQCQADNEKAMVFYRDYLSENHEGAEIVGLNMEGNFISVECRGAQDPDTIVKPDPKTLDLYNRLCGGRIMSVTYAPEECENHDFLDYCLLHSIRASIGHSNASCQCAMEAAEHGAAGVTHTGNGMKPFHHRKPGVFGAALLCDTLYCECIGDGQHVSFETAQLIGRMKGKNHFIMVTDSATQKDNSAYDAMLRDGAYRDENGTLFGSALYVCDGVYNMIHKAHLPVATAINGATINPATYLGFNDRKGSLEIGKDADILVCDDHFKPQQVFCRGISQF